MTAALIPLIAFAIGVVIGRLWPVSRRREEAPEPLANLTDLYGGDAQRGDGNGGTYRL